MLVNLHVNSILQKRPPPPPLPEPEMWPAMSSSTTAARPIENPDWQEVRGGGDWIEIIILLSLYRVNEKLESDWEEGGVVVVNVSCVNGIAV